MGCVLAAVRAVLLDLHSLRMGLLVFRRIVITILAYCTR